MKMAIFDLSLEGNRGMHARCPLTDDEAQELQSTRSGALEFRLIEKALETEARTYGLRVPLAAVEGWRLEGITTDIDRQLEALDLVDEMHQAAPAKAARERDVAKCRSLLRIGNCLLPEDVRDEALDEWMDEIECAAAKDLPIFGRALSILLRSLPILVWRTRQPARARRGRVD